MKLHTTATTTGTRYYIEGKRVSRDAFDLAKFGRRLECLQTVRIKNGYRHHCIAR